jgi:hypothetical protein
MRLPVVVIESLALAMVSLLSLPHNAYSSTSSSAAHNKCLAAKDYKGCIEAQSPQKEIFNKAVAYEQCYEYMRSGFAAAAAKTGESGIGSVLGYIPTMCNESVELQQQGYSQGSAYSTAIANLVRRFDEQKRQRDDQFTRDMINTPNPYLPYIFGR